MTEEKMRNEIQMEKEIQKIQYIEELTRTPIFSKYTVNDYDKYFADEGHHINHLSKEAFEYYYNVYEPRMKKIAKDIHELTMESQKNASESLTTNNPFCSEFYKRGDE